jgi:hypothetical protein
MQVSDVTDAPDAAVQIGMDALTECGWAAHSEEGDGADSVARAVCIALAHRGWLRDPDETDAERRLELVTHEHDRLRVENDRLEQRERDLMRERDAIEFERDELLSAKRGIR